MVLSKENEILVENLYNKLYNDYITNTSYKKTLDNININIKNLYGSIANQHLLKTLPCNSGKQNRCMTNHKICKGASTYAIQFHIQEGYTIEYAMIKGCLLWNVLYDCIYFTCTLPKKKQNILCAYLDKNDILEKMCRIHHRKANIYLLKGITYDSGTKTNIKKIPKTFWICFEEALQNISKNDDLNAHNVEYCMKQWNHKNDLDLFVI
jgi:hypothetical protein